MLATVVNTIKSEAEKIKGIKSFRYEGRDLINAQNNNDTIQIIVENNPSIEYLLSNEMIKLTINIDILDNVFQEKSLLNIQNNTLKLGVVLMKLMEKHREVMNVYDYSFLMLDRYTDDELGGCRMTIALVMPSPVSYCDIDIYIDETNQYETTKDKNINIDYPQIDINTINLTPIKLR